MLVQLGWWARARRIGTRIRQSRRQMLRSERGKAAEREWNEEAMIKKCFLRWMSRVVWVRRQAKTGHSHTLRHRGAIQRFLQRICGGERHVRWEIPELRNAKSLLSSSVAASDAANFQQISIQTMSLPASPSADSGAASPEARRRVVQRTITQHWRAHNAADSDDEGGDDDADGKSAAVDPASMCCCNSCACCERRFAQLFDLLRKVTNVSEHVSTSTLSFYSPYLEVAFSLWVERTQQMAVKNVIRIASVAFIIFFIQDFLSYPIASVIVFRGATIVVGLVFLIAFRYKPDWFKGSALLLPYGFVVWFYGFFIIVAANIRTQLVPDYVTFSPAFVLWTLVVFVMGKLTFKQSSIIVGINLVLGFISYVYLASIKKLSPTAFFSDIMCFLSISVSGAWGAYMHELGARSNFMDLYSSERVGAGADGAASSSSSSASDALGSPSPASPGSELSRTGSIGTPELTHAPSWQRDRSNSSRRGSGSAPSSRRGSQSRRSSVAKLQGTGDACFCISLWYLSQYS